MDKIPPIQECKRICVICEGYEDTAYMKRLLDLNVWSESYQIRPINAGGASNIPSRFQNAYQNDAYDIVLVFCDTDKAPYREYEQVKKKINSFFGKRKANEKLIIFANPCTMQIILSHFGDVSLKNQGKKTNADLIEQLTGIKNYDAHEEQVDAICSKIYRRTYNDMKIRVQAIKDKDTVSPSSNFYDYLERFENADTTWISAIQKFLN